jgi:hypothetical protein
MIILYLGLQIFSFLKQIEFVNILEYVKIQNWHVIVVYYVFDVKKKRERKFVILDRKFKL